MHEGHLVYGLGLESNRNQSGKALGSVSQIKIRARRLTVSRRRTRYNT